MTANRKFKDRLFKRIFEEKSNALSLYNALNDTNYCNEDELEIYSIEDAVYMGMRNDVSFLFNDEINLYEQQSTVNPNMPVRDLLYLAKQLDRYIETNELNIYGSVLQHLPVPRCVVFYNGDTDRPEIETMRLTDAFGDKRDVSAINLEVTVYNVNYPKGARLLSKCRALHDYSLFVEYVKQGKREGLQLEAAVDRAVDMAVRGGLLDGYFKDRKAEVKDMVLTEYKEEKVMKGFYEEGRKEGREEGRIEGVKQTARAMKERGMTIEEIMDITGLSAEQIEEL